jgi:O-methyltransferase
MNRAKTAAKQLLLRAGVEVHRPAYIEYLQKREEKVAVRLRETLVEFDLLARHIGFPDLPGQDGRIDLLARLSGTEILEAFYVLDALHRSLPLPGDVCEFGVAEGATSALLANELRSTEKRLWLFDSFQGLPAPTTKDELIDDIYHLGRLEAYEGTMVHPYESVVGRVAATGFPHERMTVVPGFIEETASAPGLPEQVCFAYVDFDLYEPVRTALDLLSERLVPGGRIVVDDYGFFSQGVETAVEEFINDLGGRFTRTVPPDGHGHFALLQRP